MDFKNSSDNLLKEINLNKTRTDSTFKLKAIGNKKIKHETLLYNLNKIINNSDVSYVDYTKDGKPAAEELQPLNNLFSDNIVVYYPIEDKLIKDIEQLKSKVSIKIEVEEEDVDENTPPTLNKIAKELLGSTTATVKMLLNQVGLEIKKPDIKPIGIRNTENFKYKPSTFVQLLKINLSYCNINNIFALLEDEGKIEFLHKNKIFIHDIDFTRDYKGVFNKENVIKHLINNYDFVEEGSFNPDNNPIIISNSQYVSKNCLTFLRKTNIGLIRYKFYNKFVQSMESPSVRNKIGSHINDWINNPEPILRDAIEKSLETGILRLEFTCYIYSQDTKQNLAKKDIIEEMEYLHNLMAPELIFYNPICNQFNLLCSSVLYNICIVDIDKDLAFIALYHNKLTGKVNGFYLENINVTKLSNALRWYCSNKPIIVILMHLDSANEEINIQQDCYIRISNSKEELYTYVSKGTEKLKAVQKNIDANKPEDCGLKPNNVFKFVYPSTSPSLLKSSTKEQILFKQFDIELLNYPNEALTIRSVNKELREATQEKNFMQNYEKKIDLIKEKNAVIEKQMEKSNRKEMVRNKLYKILSNIRAYTNKFLDLEDGTEIFVYGIKEANTKYGKTFILACSTDNCIKEETELKLYWSPINITHYIEAVISNGNFKQLDVKGINSYGTLKGIPLLNLIKEGSFYNASRNLCAKVVIKECKNNSKEDISKDKNILEVLEGVNIKQCAKLDDSVKEGDVIEITGYRKLKSSLIIRCSINDGEQKYYVCSYWLKQIILKKLEENENVNILSAIVGVSKTTPQKQKALLYIVN